MVGRSASQMAVISAVMARSTPSSVTIFSPGFALRITTAGPRSFARSNACSGWISNVVEATNYVLFELNQPLDAFDLAKLRGPAVVSRRAKTGEKMVKLDGVGRARGDE